MRTFAAGARLMEEGERADHVMVILGGRAKVCVEENGGERVLAVRGVGQLVGERGALQVSVRSATVIAMELLWALVVHTKDFAAFISAHPRVLGIVQSHLYRRHTGDPAQHEHGGTDTDDAYTAGYSRQHLQPLNGENCTVFLTDVVPFDARTRTDRDRLIIREALFSMTHAALQGIPDVRSADRGDGLLAVVPPNVPTARAMDQMLRTLPAELARHNGTHAEPARFRLRVAVNVGPVVSDTMGISGEGIIAAARLVEAPRFKEAIARSAASLGVIASTFVYETVIRYGRDPGELADYSEVRVKVKESRIRAWIRLLTHDVRRADPPASGADTSGLPAAGMLTAKPRAAVAEQRGTAGCSPGMIDEGFAEFLAGQRQGVLVTLRKDGRPQLSNVTYAWYPEEQTIKVSTTDDRAKTSNMRRDPRVSFHVTSGDFWSYVVVDGHAELSAVAADPRDAAVEELIDVYRTARGEHPDWDDYRAAMVRDRRLAVRLRAGRAYGLIRRG
jgi:PPOX class probable F420-dependent enzyme